MEQNKMTPEFYKTLPWRIAARKHSTSFYIIHGRDEERELQILKIHYGPHPIKEHLDRQENNAEAIVSAVNNTFGAGINPEAVPVLLETLRLALQDIEHYGNVGIPASSTCREMIKAAIEKATIK